MKLTFAFNYGSIKNVSVCNSINNINFYGETFISFGLLAGENRGIIQNCYSSGKINIMKDIYACNIGGLVGANNGTIENCYNKANVVVSCSNGDEKRIGGLVGINTSTSSIKNVYNTGDIETYFAYYSNIENGIVAKIVGIIRKKYGKY